MRAQFKLLTAMFIWGSIGLFVKNINLSSSEIALLRGAIGSIFLLGIFILMRQKISIQALKQNALLLILSGAALGFNWICLFQAYQYTTISNATLSYYLAPIIVLILAPFILKEKLTLFNAGCILAAMIGLALVNFGGGSGGGADQHLIGILYGLLAAVQYAAIILINKFIKNLSGFETTLVQLIVAVVVLFPYVWAKEPMDFSGLGWNAILFILIIGIVHTGIAYFLYFTSLKELKGQTIAVLSYLDPVSAVIFAAIFLGENMSVIQIAGGMLILGSTFLSERRAMKAQAATI